MHGRLPDLTRADAENFSINLPALGFGWDGFVSDWLMFWARVAMDRGLELLGSGEFGQGASLIETASAFARLVLAKAAAIGQVIIHECGHCYLGAGHCTPWKVLI